jgi:hypothetical protein
MIPLNVLTKLQRFILYTIGSNRFCCKTIRLGRLFEEKTSKKIFQNKLISFIFTHPS